MMLIGAGQDGALAPLTVAGVAGVAREEAGVAGGVTNGAHQLGGSSGPARRPWRTPPRRTPRSSARLPLLGGEPVRPPPRRPRENHLQLARDGDRSERAVHWRRLRRHRRHGLGAFSPAAATVHFTPGARTAWDTHPRGQTIYVTEGVGCCQRCGGPIEVIRPGDRVFFEPDEDHWHGAAPDRLMTHLAMLEVDDRGNSATWGEHVTDQEYNATAGG
jgi:quercetin dioxygenase-like cupin family protein